MEDKRPLVDVHSGMKDAETVKEMVCDQLGDAIASSGVVDTKVGHRVD